jgi:hypothetical protein
MTFLRRIHRPLSEKVSPCGGKLFRGQVIKEEIGYVGAELSANSAYSLGKAEEVLYIY